ncbi:hypothetical protein EYF80_022472 [Liparis tanakae]|uniref:Uncharacterized protein n=1 Tax=Liparis tanakae TaxID=230148 RepID=A0A4Z2HQ35_9TELE|nr:hypothetical protein EYF80_022472 [Liparis tanakae]
MAKDRSERGPHGSGVNLEATDLRSGLPHATCPRLHSASTGLVEMELELDSAPLWGRSLQTESLDPGTGIRLRPLMGERLPSRQRVWTQDLELDSAPLWGSAFPPDRESGPRNWS